jgi:hypothetical protein
MTREKQIRQAGIEYTIKNRPMCIGGGAFSEVVDEMNRNHAFEEGAKWADEHPNLYNNEKYHTVKVSCLDELARKAALYDEFLDKACEWIKNNKSSYKVWSFGSLHTDWDKFIREFRKAMEE